ncbi:MAG: hypothetical protein Unbinned5179contig1001_30 [Prokaryotic dsDNA virus sp.]|nr:MAG: hypothetical protein Unbinned5179contig1001_30 [Prokaryotic dsDNA virus sp.]|tara:strand:+ start:8002 stop:8292 length:291 start_codon:yes stop_codon:yes gene_type:complete
MPALTKKPKRAGPLTLGSYVRELRAENKVTLRTLSKQTGISVASLFRLERGDHVPSIQRDIDALDKLWIVLGGDMNQLLYLSRRCPVCEGTGRIRG